MSTDETATKRRDGYAVAAFWLAFFLMIAPTEGDMLVGLMFAKRVDLVLALVAACYLIVLYPWFVSLRRHRREPGVWSGKGYLIGTGIILIFNLLMVGTVLTNMLIGSTGG